MKIAIIAGRDPNFKNDTDGGSVFLKNLIRDSLDKGHKVDVYTPLGFSGSEFDNKKLAEQGKYTEKEFKNLNFFRFTVDDDSTVKTGANEDENSYFLNRINLSFRLAKYFEDKKLFNYDLVFILHVANAFGVVNEGFTPIEKTVMFPMMTSSTYALFSTVPKEYIDLEKKTLQKFLHISSPAEDEMNLIVRDFEVKKNNIFKTNRGFDITNFIPKQRISIKDNKTIKLFSANGIRPQKNHLFFVPLVIFLIQNGLDVEVHLTGNDGASHNKVYNEYRDKFWNEVKNNNLEKYFISHGVVTEKELNNIMSSSDIALYPCTAETFGKSALESMATGLPTIVGNNIPAFGEFIINKKTGMFIDLDVEVFGKEILNLINHPDQYVSISRLGIKQGERFTWKNVMDEFFAELGKRLAK